MSEDIQAYLRISASRDREVERAGPFLATFTAHDANPYLNYAIPDTAARPTPDDVAGLVDAFERRQRAPRLEYLPGLAPAVEPALLAAGFTVEQRLPLMECPPDGEAPPAALVPVSDGVELVTPVTDDDLRAMVTAQHEAFGEAPPGSEHFSAARRLTAAGGIALLARDVDTGEPVGGGAAVATRDGISEVAGIAVREPYRKRGIGGALTQRLTLAAQAAGAGIVFLMPGGDAQERVYARVGYRRIDSVLFLAKRGMAA